MVGISWQPKNMDRWTRGGSRRCIFVSKLEAQRSRGTNIDVGATVAPLQLDRKPDCG